MTFPFLFPPFFGFGFIFYFLPSIIALARSKRSTLSIFFLNLFLGWTLVGWVVALVWAVKADDPHRVDSGAKSAKLVVNDICFFFPHFSLFVCTWATPCSRAADHLMMEEKRRGSLEEMRLLCPRKLNPTSALSFEAVEASGLQRLSRVFPLRALASGR
jgi:hypothetical protein